MKIIRRTSSLYAAALLLVLSLFFASHAIARPVVVATVPALGQIAQAIGGVDIDVKIITSIGHDPNVFSPRPGHARMLINADLIFAAGFGLESSWLPSLIKLSGNQKILPGSDGYLSGGDAIEAIGVPLGMSSHQMSQWSPDKNPHWWLDPEMGIKVAKTLSVRLSEVDTVNAQRYKLRFREFEQAINEALPRWRDYMKIHTGAVITYHNTYVYFMDSMQIELAGFIEPRSGIEPSTRYMESLLTVIKERNVKLIWVEPYNNRAIAKRLADEAGIKMMVLPDAVEGIGTQGYVGMFDKMVERIARWSQ
ncbi:metal ABC transporter substrate-binding protein [Mariprofundus micogutta]|nr:metal ABC transporter substrate-binding protein [Mariprofundus micogutta]